MKLDDIVAYSLAVELSSEIWEIVHRWDYFAKDTVGKQLVRSIDSIGANIAEGFGRYHFSEKITFYYYARGSVFEAQFFVKRAQERQLVSVEQYDRVMSNLRKLPKELNTLIYLCRRQKK